MFHAVGAQPSHQRGDRYVPAQPQHGRGGLLSWRVQNGLFWSTGVDATKVAVLRIRHTDERLGYDCSLAAQAVAIEKGELTGRPRQRGGLRPRECAAGR